MPYRRSTKRRGVYSQYMTARRKRARTNASNYTWGNIWRKGIMGVRRENAGRNGMKVTPVKAAPSSRRTFTRNRKITRRGTMGITRMRQGPRKTKPSTASLYGSIQEQDLGATITDPNCIYLGHATFVSADMLLSMARAITRKLYRKAGLDCKDWNEQLPTLVSGKKWGVRMYRHFKNAEGFDSTSDFVERTVATGSTYLDVAAAVNTMLRADFPTSSHEIKQIELKEYASDDTQGDVHSKMDAGRVKIHFQCTSELRIQNITQAQGSDGVTGQLIEDIGNNPLQGKYYTASGNGFIEKAQFRASTVGNQMTDGSNVNKKGFVAGYSNNGLIAGLAADIAPLRKPLKGNDFINCKSEKNSVIKPGDIKMSRIYAGHVMPINGFLNAFRIDINNAETPTTTEFPYRTLGKSAMFALRRTIDMKTSEKAPTLGYQLNYKVGSYVTESFQNNVPDIFLTTGFVNPPP